MVATGTLVFDLSLAPLIEHFWALFVAANVVSFALAFWLHRRASAARPGPDDARPRSWSASSCNPRVFGVDLKMWAYEPSLIGFGLLVAAFGYAQFERHGEITPQMGLWLVGWWIYLATHYAQQAFLLSIFDVIEEKFGLMLLWGDLVLVPFFYSIGGWWLLDQREPMSRRALLAIAALYAAEPLDVPRRQRAEVALQAGPGGGDLGREGRGDRRAPADLGLVGDRPAPELHRRDRRLPGAHARDRLRRASCPICCRSGCSCCSPTAPPATIAAAARSTARSGRAYCAHTRFRMFPFLY